MRRVLCCLLLMSRACMGEQTPISRLNSTVRACRELDAGTASDTDSDEDERSLLHADPEAPKRTQVLIVG